VGKVTLQTVADAVGVSRMTVSNAFSRPDQLSAPLRERILEAARELGYAGPDPSARALARGSTGAVGVVLTDSLEYPFTDEVAMSFLGAIARELEPTGLALTLLSGAETEDRVPARDVAMDGALVYSCDPRSAAVEWLGKRGLPMVFVDQAPATGIPSVNVDDRGGARLAAQHLVDLGHRRIGVVVSVPTGPYGLVDAPLDEPLGHAVRQRLLGWFDALTAAGITPVVARIPFSDHDACAEAAQALLRMDDRPTAVLCFSDVLAATVVQVAQDLGLQVPADVSVVGFDDSPVAARVRPPLTTVRQDFTEKGRAAAAALTAALSGPAPKRARHTVLPTTLVVRESTAAPAAH
jgi:DNA-binding LacI/PurR family transcriptional regulator